jgi:hypothetical protein
MLGGNSGTTAQIRQLLPHDETLYKLRDDPVKRLHESTVILVRAFVVDFKLLFDAAARRN